MIKDIFINLLYKIKNIEYSKYLNGLLSYINIHKVPIISVLSLIIYIVLSYVFYFKLTDKYQSYSTASNIVLSVGFIALLFGILKKNYLNEDVTPNIITYIKYFSGLVSSILLLIGLIYLFSKSKTITLLFTYLINIGLILGLLILSYIGFQKIPFLAKLKENTFFSLIYNFIFYIPCVVLDIYSNTGKATLDITTTSFVTKVLIVEAILIFLYFVGPKIIEALYNHKGRQLLKEPVFLNKQITHAKYEQLNGGTDEDIVKHNYNYALSAWVFIHNQSPKMTKEDSEFISILDYGGKPNISYSLKSGTLRVSMLNGEGSNENVIIYETTHLKLQKWNYIVLNYNSGILDVFINSKLVATSKNVVPYITLDDITSGEDMGLSGGISNIMYYNEPIEKTKIEWLYNTYKNKETPYL